MEILKFLLLSGMAAVTIVMINTEKGRDQITICLSEATNEELRISKRVILEGMHSYLDISEQTTFAGVK